MEWTVGNAKDWGELKSLKNSPPLGQCTSSSGGGLHILEVA